MSEIGTTSAGGKTNVRLVTINAEAPKPL